MLVGVVEFLGWFGAGTVLVGYVLFSLGKIANGPVYQLFNLVGGVAIAVNVAAHHAVPSTIVNSIWAAVAAVVLARMVVRRRRGTSAGVQPAPELHAEPPTTTAVLPVVGPALRDHQPEADHRSDADHRSEVNHRSGVDHRSEADQQPEPDQPETGHRPDGPLDEAAPTGLPAGRTTGTEATSTDATSTDATGTDATGTAATGTDAPAPMTETVPVITATIALALVQAAHQQHAAQQEAAQQQTTQPEPADAP
ncbi:hypothetical protein DEJ16_04930 [Curtobacterium sp. MCJR17_055]|uniref:CBU_0592 family membrane protein n=1 Tax=unclassified Curtobacterium TaxID=257496 RepID=UPI000D9BC18F|nr:MULTISPECIES: hypothetical protein [unclassified Curtobacterium]PYY37690.1 hypothetical protein DEI87_00685 [Curtobacterium sp. MCBD17_029]PYY56718.1 hypothetical protein DEJ16_04930 [Curtobacterium sp. MCJR17_055]PYY62367.1 hypothetical protein DEJ26_02595 [Curtobacterium sp. MCPF17_015]